MNNMEIKIDLSNYTERFAPNSKDFSISKKVNFIFGKNGTGKTTITEAIKNQFNSTHNLYAFDGYEGVVGENHRLDAIALGTENTVIQKQIETINEEIVKIKKEVEKPKDKSENLFTKLEKAGKEYKDQDRKIDNFYAGSAKTIKNKTNPQVAKTTYDKNAFKNEIASAKLLSDDEIQNQKETIKSEQKPEVNKITFSNIDLDAFLKSTNEVLTAKVAQQQVIAELQDNLAKQNFAREGLKIHKHEKGEKCAFCGNEISDERWALLGGYFNDEVKNLESRIDTEISKVSKEISNIENIKEISKSDFYDKFTERIKLLNSNIKNVKSDYKAFFDSLKIALENKKKNLFTVSDEVKPTIPQSFSTIKTEYGAIVDEHNIFSKNLKSEQEHAKDALRLHEVKLALDKSKYDVENNKSSTLKTAKEQAKQELDKKKQELEDKKTEKNNLILQTKDENKISEEINKLLKNMGVSSFSLELVNDTDENQKGQYKIKGHNQRIRSINELSKGEKNIVAFLYFILSLSQPTENNKPKIIVLDDPMTSNDDTMQYLMIGEIQKHIENIEQRSEYFILFTHNCHFYLNVRANKMPYNKHNKHGNFHLWSDGKLTTITPIAKTDDDFKTNYEMLWKELLFLYERDKPNLMLNSCRKICETYSKFNCIENFYNNNANAKKLFDVNQHSIDDLEAEQNGRTKDDIKNILEALFKTNNSEKHFNTYWTLSPNTESNE
jgi:wobble nucleotide-excising tRNase